MCHSHRSFEKEKKLKTPKTRNKGILCVASASVEEIYAFSPSILGVWLDVLQLMEKMTILT